MHCLGKIWVTHKKTKSVSPTTLPLWSLVESERTAQKQMPQGVNTNFRIETVTGEDHPYTNKHYKIHHTGKIDVNGHRNTGTDLLTVYTPENVPVAEYVLLNITRIVY